MLQSEGKKRTVYFEQIDILRGIAIALVVLGHAVALPNINNVSSEVCESVYKFIYSFHMPLFFVISGFCFQYTFGQYQEFVTKKIKRLLVPYFVFNSITIMMQRVLPFFTVDSEGLWSKIWKVFFKGGDLWFVYVLFFVFLLAPILLKIINKNKYSVVLLIIMFTILSILFSTCTVMCLNVLLYQMIYFIIGMMIRQLCNIEEINRLYLRITTLFCLVVQIVLLCFIDQVKIFAVQRILQIITALMGIVVAYGNADFLLNNKIKKIIKFLGNYSLEIYLFNGYFISVSRTVLTLVFGINNVCIMACFNTIFGLVLNIMFIYVMSKNFVFRKICGKI